MDANEIMSRPGLLKLYKGKGAASFSLISPQYDDRGFMSKHGAILLEVAPSVGKQEWDWNQKMKFAISIADICSLADPNPDKRRIYHEHNDTPKTLEFREGEGAYAGTFMMTLSEGKGASRKSFSVPLTGGEFRVLMGLFSSTVPLLLGWTDNAMEGQVRQRSNYN